MIQETKRFKKAFHTTGLVAKVDITYKLAELVNKKQFPGGRKMTPEEYHLISDLLEWCNQNVFFDTTPRYDVPKNF